MNSKELVRAALNNNFDKVYPMQISYTPEFKDRLLKHFTDLDVKDPHALDLKLGSDLLLTPIGWMNNYNQGREPYTDEWGVGWKTIQYETRFGKGIYTEPQSHPLEDYAAVDSYSTPDPDRDSLYGNAEILLKNHGKSHFIVGVVKATIFESSWALRGLDKLMMDLVLDKELAARILDLPFQYHKAVAQRLVQMGVDMIWLGDDVGTQNGMMISPDTWREFLKPLMQEMISSLKSINPEVKIAYHSDGNIVEIIPELIEIGLDVLNPIQPNCMDPVYLMEQFGDRLCFWGGVDQQQLMPFGTEDEIKAEVQKLKASLGKKGGYIMGPTHNLQLDVPLENLFAMIDEIKELTLTEK